MLKLYTRAVYVFLNIVSVFGGKSNGNKTTTTTDNPLANILSKFHQSDFKITYEWSETVHSDKSCVDYKHVTFKYNRTITAVNVTFLPKIDVGYDLEVVIQGYRFASNEYRFFPIRFQFNLCEAVEKRTMGLDKFTTNGNFSCPLLKGIRYHYYNWSPEEAMFPPYIPAGKYMIESQFLHRSKEVLLTRDYGSVYRPINY